MYALTNWNLSTSLDIEPWYATPIYYFMIYIILRLKWNWLALVPLFCCSTKAPFAQKCIDLLLKIVLVTNNTSDFFFLTSPRAWVYQLRSVVVAELVNHANASRCQDLPILPTSSFNCFLPIPKKKKHKSKNNSLVRQRNVNEIFLSSTSKYHTWP